MSRMSTSGPELISSGHRSTPSPKGEGHLRRKPRMESRMLGNSHVRFGERDGETCLGDGVKRLVPTPPAVVGFFERVVDEMLNPPEHLADRAPGLGLPPDDRDNGNGLRAGASRSPRHRVHRCFRSAAIGRAVEGDGNGSDPGAGEGGENRSLVAGAEACPLHLLG